MVEESILIEGIDPIQILGVNNSKLKLLKTMFPEIKIVARGNKMKLQGTKAQVALFKRKYSSMVSYIEKFDKITLDEMKEIVEKSDAQNASALKDVTLVHSKGGALIKAQTNNQRKLVQAVMNSDLVFAIGPAGTGKTFTSVALAVNALKAKQVKRIILTRPAVESGEQLGFLPGDMKEKLDPYMQPLYDALRAMIPPEKLKEHLEKGVIEIAPLAYMRGRTLDNSFVILDESQNTTEGQLRMFLTRMGKSAKFVVTGDITQIDLPAKQKSGLLQAKRILKGVRGIEFIELNAADIMRHKLVSKIISAYSKEV